jgi:hypothetical protein
MDEMDREVQDRISRRRMIKRLGAATAVAWTAPVLSSLGTPAFAQGSPACTNCPPLSASEETHCAITPICGEEADGNLCDCRRTPEDTCICASCIFCDDPGVTPCTSSAQCPAGWACAASDCSCNTQTPELEFTCLPLCNAGNPSPGCTPAAAAARVGRTSRRR